MINLTTGNFDALVLGADRPVLVDFWAEWCPPCRMIAPVLDEVEAEYGERLTVAELNGDLHPEIAQRYHVLGYPTLNLYRDGELVHQIVGARSKRALLAELGTHL